MRVHTDTHTHTYTQTHTHTCMRAHTDGHTDTDTHTCTHTQTDTQTQTHSHARVHTDTHMLTQTDTQTHTPSHAHTQMTRSEKQGLHAQQIKHALYWKSTVSKVTPKQLQTSYNTYIAHLKLKLEVYSQDCFSHTWSHTYSSNI